MNPHSNRARLIDDMFAILSWLPSNRQHEAVLIFFATRLRQLDSADIHATRVHLVQEAPPCPCGCDNRATLAEILDGHLMLRELGLISAKR